MEENQKSGIKLQYQLNKEIDEIKIFGYNFVKNNINNCKIIFQEKEIKLREYIDINNSFKDLEKKEIKLIGFENVSDMREMFKGCELLISIEDNFKLNQNNILNMAELFSGCFSLNSIPDISKWKTNKVKDMNRLFYECYSLDKLPNITKWETDNVKNMSGLFAKCSSLESLLTWYI